MSYPDFFLRGISDQTHIDKNKQISGHAFSFTLKRDQQPRVDGYNEESILWKDDEGAVNLILSQKKIGTDQIQFKIGAVVLDRNFLDLFLRRPQITDILAYERKIDDPSNPYHGNLLLKSDTTPQNRKNIGGIIASCQVDFIPPLDMN